MSDYRPNFIIGGAPRSGTTYLAQALAQHPDIFMAQPFIPEPKVLMLPEQSEGHYLARYRELFGNATSTQIRGEKTSYYLESVEARTRIHALMPQAKLLFIVREPIERAYSNYHWSKKNGLETLGFKEAIAAEGTRPNPLPPDKAYARPFDYLTRGDYAALAEPYFNLFGPDQVKFVLYEDIVRNNDGLFRTIQQFIGVPTLATSLDVGVVNAVEKQGSEIDSALLSELRDRMRPAVRRFAALTGLDLSYWGYD